jgi:F420-0:gamma-glutamyl ligase
VIVKTIKTARVSSAKQTIFELLDQYLPALQEGSIVAITSKVVALCEGRVIPFNSVSKKDLIMQESEYFLPPSSNKFNYNFSINNNTLTSMAGIDESNGDGCYILWPKDVQKSANEIRKYLVNKTGLKDLGIIITDSTCVPLRWGTVGNALAYSGFMPLNSYVGKPDLFAPLLNSVKWQKGKNVQN